MRHLLYIVPTLIALWLIDNALSEDRYAGWERNSVRNSMRRWAERPKAKVAIFGSSTSKDWLSADQTARVTGVRRGDVLDAHINGCHQGCTWASVQKLRQRGYHFEVAFFGTNLFQLCEEDHSKRVLQHQMMTPALDAPALFGLYLHARQPLRPMARYLGMTLSGAYADTAVLQRGAARRLFGEPVPGKAYRWYRDDAPAASEVLSCRYEDDDIAYKHAISEALLDDLQGLADHVFLMMLPDRSVGLDEAEHVARWQKHLTLHQAMADARPRVTLIDLVHDGVRDERMFRDGFHLNRQGMAIQQRLFTRRMKEAGWPRPAEAKTK